MKPKILLILIVYLFQYNLSYSQTDFKISWWNPVQHDFKVIEGQGWPENLQSDYDRLPLDAEGKVRKAVWNLSKHAAGLSIRFRSNSSEIKIRYKVNGNFAMPHMPATGVSGVDLYAKNSNGEWMWCRGNYAFGDTIKYDFKNINPKDQYHELGREYHLYLPLYNSVEWLEIGVPENTRFKPLPIRREKPIVVYGTSIAQGACASRPGMAWTSILERKMDNPLINLGFSGNGRLEKEMIDLISEIDAKLYILDCLPNLSPNKNRSLDDVRQRIISSVKNLSEKRPEAPIVLVEHAGYSDGSTNIKRKEIYTELNRVLRETYAWLKAEGADNIYLLTKAEIKLGFEDFVDGTHPSDLGMMHYAEAYEEFVRLILHEPIGKSSTTIPVTQLREPGNYDWDERHQELLKMNKANAPKICFFGNSITHFWGGLPEGPFSKGGNTWDENFKDLGVRNFGFGWDRVENVLWRIYHEELDGFDAEQIVLMLGTNNLHLNTDEEIIEGLELLIQAMKVRQENASISLIGLLPRKNQEARVYELNLKIAKLAGSLQIYYVDIGRNLLNQDGTIKESLFSDGLHPNIDGYRILGSELKQYLKR